MSLSLTAQSKRHSQNGRAYRSSHGERQTRTQGQDPDSQGNSSLLPVDEVTLNTGTGSMLVPTSFATSASKRLMPVGVLRLRRSGHHAMEGNPAMGGWLPVGIRPGKPMPECPCCLEEVKMEAETEGGNKGARGAVQQNMRLLAVETSGRRERYRENGTMLAWFLFAAQLDAGALPPSA